MLRIILFSKAESRRFLLILIIACVVGMSNAFTIRGADKIQEINAITAVEVLANLPNIAECRVEICREIPVTSNNGETFVVSGKQRKCCFVLLRWQTNAFLYREAPTLEGLDSAKHFTGYFVFSKYASNYWYFDPGSSVLAKTDTASPYVAQAVESGFKNKMSAICNVGFFDTIPNSVHINHSNQISPFTNVNSLTINGHVELDQRGWINRALIDLKLQKSAIPWEIEYTYTDNSRLPEGFPSSVVASTLSPEKEVRFTIKYLNIIFSRSTLPQDYFTVEKFMNKGTLELDYSRNQDQMLAAATEKPKNNSPARRWMLIALFIIPVLVVFVGCIRRKATSIS